MSHEHKNELSFRVMTYNIRMDTPDDGQNQWHLRKDRVIRLIEKYSPDLLGVQEALPQQMSDLRNGLVDYASYGVGRNDGKDNGEFSAIFYRRNRFELLDQGTFWLSETPNIPGSRGWDAALPRICSWIKINDKRANQELYYFNTHFDHRGSHARCESARLIVSYIEQITKRTIPAILTGDLNVGPESETYQTFLTHTILQDAKLLTKILHSGPHGTWSTFSTRHGIGDRIDYIFLTPINFTVINHSHITDSENQFYPSDHLPVLAELTYAT